MSELFKENEKIHNENIDAIKLILGKTGTERSGSFFDQGKLILSKAESAVILLSQVRQ